MKTQQKTKYCQGLLGLVLVSLLITGCISKDQYSPTASVLNGITETVATEQRIDAVSTVDSTEALSVATELTEETQETTEPITIETEDAAQQKTAPTETPPEETIPQETNPQETTPLETSPSPAEDESGSGYPNDPASCSHMSLKIVEAREPTPEQDGMILMRCGDCGYELRTEQKYTPPEETESAETEPPQVGTIADPADVESFLLQYINQFRANQGSSHLTYLPGLSKVAKYRSEQIVYNFAHDTTAEREALAYYQYGRWVNPADYGIPNGVGYYTYDGGEAIGKGEGIGVEFMSAEELGRKMAESYLNSPNHWRYVGSSEYSFIGVGVTFANGTWYNCVLVGTVNYG